MLGSCFSSDTLKKTAVYEWHERFKSGRESVEDDERSDRPSTSKIDENINKNLGVDGGISSRNFTLSVEFVGDEVSLGENDMTDELSVSGGMSGKILLERPKTRVIEFERKVKEFEGEVKEFEEEMKEKEKVELAKAMRPRLGDSDFENPQGVPGILGLEVSALHDRPDF
ncbi:PREDICTED: putative uncharacterized protein FLJ37770 [Atta cephalotes]|uniref:Mos1 transposase HTH domain-containing protein n=1 Tax=Atta cephalotes TaxID=12957 RepID=A0A158NNG1_ATTCE|nr:PREDICTED: putative uncharacterized protein FLJ37770 [Atta cephalotes]